MSYQRDSASATNGILGESAYSSATAEYEKGPHVQYLGGLLNSHLSKDAVAGISSSMRRDTRSSGSRYRTVALCIFPAAIEYHLK